MTRDRALELAAREPAEAMERGAGASAGVPRDVRALLVGAALTIAAGLAWTVLAPAPRDSTTPVLGWIDPGPPDPATLRAKKAPAPQPPFKLPWWR